MYKLVQYVVLAYAAIWLITFIYLISLGERIYRLRKEIDLVKRQIQKEEK